MNSKIGFIGAGNMTYAIVSGLVNSYPDDKQNIYVSSRTVEKAEIFCKEFDVSLAVNNRDLVKNCEIIVLAVKPVKYEEVLNEIKDIVTSKHVIVSLAAGIEIKYIEQFFDEPTKIVRTMPNTPVLVGAGMTAVTKNDHLSQEDLEAVLNLFESIGRVDVIDESLMDSIPAISGSSPAYVYIFIEALADGGVLQGLSREKAYKYAAQAVLGAAKMVLEKEKHPGELKDMVCSPAGATIEAVYSLEKSNFRGAVIRAMNACTEKVKQMGKMKD
ncbi:pyrroline-5-carboxylate reductase [Anaerosolibacter carboniphilus]|uniref:Pyrroline-5-carboxylate reductase n=1 Tax=Anaerosolibacter carboniphilus TaxID=1417629 RepID=A0A841KT11_9FIRM|nr:pyrroline-5-carboxylate reductase [Anaerosolibacter carboniphilus]MBB6216557.1 pyrroline-5-carboxylate reductase [Anaerosolibacter carboniphilus]